MLLAKFLLNHLFVNDIAVVINLINHKNIKSGHVWHCYDDVPALLMYKTFHENNLRVSSKRITNNIDFNLPHQYDKVAIVVNTSCQGWNNVFSTFDYENAFKSPYIWIIMTENLTETADVLSRYKIQLNSDVTVITKLNKISILYEMYYTGFNNNSQFIIREIGEWNNSLRIQESDRKNLKGTVLRSAVVILQKQKFNKTFVRYLDEEKPDLIKTDPLHKMKFYTPLKYFQDMYNITLILQRTNSWGYPTNGSFDGMAGMLQRGEVDIGGSPLFIRPDRDKAIHFVAEAWPTVPRFIFRHPKHPGGFFTIYTRPLTTRVWYCIIAVMIVSSVVLAALLKLEIIKAPGDDGDQSPSLAVLFIWSAICQQGMSISRNSLSVKVVVFVTFIFALTLYQYYNATVVSTLLREPPKNIRTSKDLLKSNLKAGIEDILYNKDNFKRTTDPLARKIFKEKIAKTTPYNFFSERKVWLWSKKANSHSSSTNLLRTVIRRTFTEKEICELQEVTLFEPMSTGVAVGKGSPYREIVAYGIRKMKESGILSRIQSVWDEPRPTCVRTPDSSVFSVTLHEFSAALMVLTVGYTAALLVLIVEILVYRIEEKKTIEFRH